MIPGVDGFIYPNEAELQWSVLIVLYPYITGLVAGAFILASLERVFKVDAVRPTYRMALLTALAFLLVAPLPLQLHLGHPERSFEMYLTPHRSSAMAMFGFVYLWYLTVVLLLEIWLEYRAEIVGLAQSTTGPKRWIYRALTLGSYNVSPEARRIDEKVGYAVTVIGIPSAFLLHGYVGFIFGSVKANPWWSTPLMPVVFLFSAMVSGIAAVMVLYVVSMKLRKTVIDMPCLDTIARYLFYTFVIDFSLEMLDLVHRTYESDESFRSLDFMVHTRLWGSQVILQIFLGTLLPLVLLAANQLWTFSEARRKAMYMLHILQIATGGAGRIGVGNPADAPSVCDLADTGETLAAMAGGRGPQSLRRLPCRNRSGRRWSARCVRSPGAWRRSSGRSV